MYTTFYDMISQSSQIEPPWGEYAVGLMLFGLIMIASLAITQHRKGNWAIVSMLMVVVFVADLWGTYRGYRTYAEVRRAVEAHQYATVEGCFSTFHAGGSMGTPRNERREAWRVAGTDFDYEPGQGEPGFDSAGSSVIQLNSRSRVRVSYMMIEGHRRIMRLDVMANACPPAPDLYRQNHRE